MLLRGPPEMQNTSSSTLKPLGKLRSLNGTPKSFQIPSQMSSDGISARSFVDLKITAEKMVKDQASAKSELEMASLKLKKLTDRIHVLEAKLQSVNNENARLKVKLGEDSKLWSSLESKLCSSHSLFDEMTQTLQRLAQQVEEAERDKKCFENKLAASSIAFDDLNTKLNSLTLKLESAEENIANGKNELSRIKAEKGDIERSQAAERVRNDMLVAEKDAAVQRLEIAVNEQKKELETLDCQLQDAKTVLRLKEDLCSSLAEKFSQAEKDKAEIQCRCGNFEKKSNNLIVELKSLEDEVYRLTDMLVQLDPSSLTTSKNILQLTSSWENYDRLIQQEKLLLAKSAKLKFDHLHARYLEVTSENGVFQSEVEVLKTQVIELRRDLDARTLQSKEEREIAGEKIQKSQLELERFRLKETELMATIAELEEKVSHSSKTMSKFEDQKQELKMQMLSLESLNRDIQEKAESLLQGKKDEIEALHEDMEKHCNRVESLEIQISLLRVQLDEKEKAELNLKEREKELVEKIVQMQSSLSAVECSLAEAKKQYDMMLEAKQLELTRHLKEISQRNDQEINDIRRKYELEKQEVIKLEKEKANNTLTEAERKHEEALKQLREKELEHLQQAQDEHDALVKKIQFEYSSRELDIREKHDEEKKGLEIHWENESREKTMSLRREHEAQIKIMAHEHQDELRKVQEELELQKSKEEKQRALLQLQWKVMDDNRQDDPEVNSKKAFSASSIKMLDTDVGKRHHAVILENENYMNSAIPGVVGSPAKSLPKGVEGWKPSDLIGIPKHSKKVMRHEYEVKTANGRTITKRRKTKSTLMIGNHLSHKINMDKSIISKQQQIRKGKGNQGTQVQPSSIGDLFKESSLDPYAFD